MNIPLALAVMDPRDLHPVTFDFSRTIPPSVTILPDSVQPSLDVDSLSHGVQIATGPHGVAVNGRKVTVHLRVAPGSQDHPDFLRGILAQVTLQFSTSDVPTPVLNRSGFVRIRRR